MRRSVRWHLLLNSLVVSLAAIIAIGAVTLILVETYFSRQEEQYLRERGNELIPTLESALHRGGRSDLQLITSYGLFTGHVRIQVLDYDGLLLADSGNFDNLTAAGFYTREEASLTAFEFYLDDLGRLQGFGLPFEGEREMAKNVPRTPWSPADLTQRSVAPSPQPPITAVSDTVVRFPLRVNDRVVAYAQL